MILISSIRFIRKLFENNMYSISTETGAVVFQPETDFENDIIADTANEQ